MARKLTRKVVGIPCRRKVHATTPAEVDEVIDSSRQRLYVLSAGLWGKKRASARKEEEQIFGKDEKRFFRQLSGVQLQDLEIEVTYVEEMVDFWTDI